jgi:hypothetical protein
MEGNEKKHVQVKMAVNIWVDTIDPRRIHKETAFAGITAGDDQAYLFDYNGKPGFKDLYSCNPDSADYDPARYNRCLKLLHDQGKALDVPMAEVPPSRMLRDRWPLLSLKLKRQILGKLLHA